MSRKLRFECTGCGGCCTGRGNARIEYYVAVTPAEQRRIRKYLGVSPAWFRRRYLTRFEDGDESLRWEGDRCVFLDGDKRCRIYPVRPVQYRVNLDNRPPVPVAKTPEVVSWLRGRTYSATALDAYLACPLRFYYRIVLGLGKREEVSGEIERADIGLFVHSVLARYFGSRLGRRLGPQDVDPPLMEAIVEELFAARYGTGDAGAGRLLKRQISSHLQEFLTGYLAPQLGRRITFTALEKDLAMTHGSFALRGRVDAILERGGVPWLIDYKTGNDARRYRVSFARLDPADRTTWNKAVGSLQLPLYVMLAADALGRPPEDMTASVLLLGRRRLDAGIEISLFDDEHPAASEYPKLVSVIDGLLAEIVDPAVPFEPARNRREACPYCDLAGVCGTQWMS